MSELPFDPENPPDEPPPEVVQPMAWRLAVRLHRDHSPQPVEPLSGVPLPAGPLPAGPLSSVPGSAGANTCRTCGDPWPCHGRRIAVRGLLAACRPPRSGRAG
ncbi:hypothetical protein I0C86_37445 [Plantactinospora sp. S1510]|uniref:Uncharacterized protein n=1 Tax=Plantactinospora alkalitolerans TaxID=2789879 RepID=A0ABS0H8V8_9ACTN|nr:hypothetical protein [Plantactinospora alkalitolerans]MBF9134574.1 hypothetical protein [Plantactinospora alkalitolerans]